MAKRLGVVRVEVLDVQRLEPGTLEGEQHAGQVQELAVREHVAVRELSADVGAAFGRRHVGDAVIEHPPARLEHAGDPSRVLVDLPFANVLDHADAGHRVEPLLAQVAVVHHLELDPIADPGLAGPLGRQLGLRLRKGDPQRRCAVLPGGVDSEAPPATADVEHPHSRLELQLAADQLELRALGVLERVRSVLEQRAAVGHALIEEQGEELVRDVVVVADRLGVPALGVSAPPGSQLGRWGVRPAPYPGGSERRAGESGADAASPSGGGLQRPSSETTPSRSSTSISPQT